jgi:hypothetical protein
MMYRVLGIVMMAAFLLAIGSFATNHGLIAKMSLGVAVIVALIRIAFPSGVRYRN